MKLRRGIQLTVAVALMVPTLTSCFTGVESTPKITAREIRKKRIEATPEIKLMESVTPEPVASWQPGKAFRITDDRIGLIFSPGVAGYGNQVPDSLTGRTLRLMEIGQVTGITGEQEAVVTFMLDSGQKLVFRPGITYDAMTALSQFAVPFTVEMSVVERADSLLRGHTYYYLAARRMDRQGNEITGPRYQPVTVTHVGAGTDTRPLRIYFTDTDGDERSVLATIGRTRTATRNFNTLFAMSNPREKYREITDKTWKMIVESTVEPGMTTQECLLALGSPNEHLRLPSTGGMVERWSYDNGIYLYFEDGHLARYRR